MKYLLIFALLFCLFSCRSETVDYVRFSGTIKNTSRGSISVQSGNYIKKIMLEEDGSFEDTLRIERGYYLLTVDGEQVSLFLRSGYDMEITADAGNLINTITYTGRGAENNNYVIEKTRFMREGIGEPGDYFKLEKDDFEIKVTDLKKTLDTMLSSHKQLDSMLIAREDSLNRRFIYFLNSNYERGHARFEE